MKNNKFLIGVIAAVALLLLGGVYLATSMKSSTEVKVSANAKAVVSENTLDWGEFGISEGNKEAFFTIKNEGTDPLQLSNVITSCACTTAQLIMGDKLSPAFGMHNKSAYIFEVPAGQEAQVKVVFDPMFHGPNGVGPISREIKITTNDLARPELKFMVNGMVNR